jgi:hypothetical protein
MVPESINSVDEGNSGILSNEVYHMAYQSASVMIVDSMKGGGFKSQATRGTLSHRSIV